MRIQINVMLTVGSLGNVVNSGALNKGGIWGRAKNCGENKEWEEGLRVRKKVKGSTGEGRGYKKGRTQDWGKRERMAKEGGQGF